jgi:hypothetical protein
LCATLPFGVLSTGILGVSPSCLRLLVFESMLKVSRNCILGTPMRVRHAWCGLLLLPGVRPGGPLSSFVRFGLQQQQPSGWSGFLVRSGSGSLHGLACHVLAVVWETFRPVLGLPRPENEPCKVGDVLGRRRPRRGRGQTRPVCRCIGVLAGSQVGVAIGEGTRQAETGHLIRHPCSFSHDIAFVREPMWFVGSCCRHDKRQQVCSGTLESFVRHKVLSSLGLCVFSYCASC